MPHQQTKLILGLVGEIASGKDTVAAYLKKNYRSETVSFSQPIRDILDRLYLPQTRTNMSELGIGLRQTFGQDLLSKVIAEEVKNSQQKIVSLPNVRLASDLIYLKKLPGFYLIHIDTEQKTRFQRLKKRTQNADDQNKTWPEFLRDSRLPTETKIRHLAKKARYQLDNNGSFSQLYRQINELIKKIR